MEEHIHVPAGNEEPHMTNERAAVHFDHVFGGRPGQETAVAIDLPAPWEDDGEAKDTLKELSYDRTKRSWNGDTWWVTVGALNTAVRHMAEAGYDVTVALDVAREFEDGVGGASRTGRVFLPEHKDGEQEDAQEDADAEAEQEAAVMADGGAPEQEQEQEQEQEDARPMPSEVGHELVCKQTEERFCGACDGMATFDVEVINKQTAVGGVHHTHGRCEECGGRGVIIHLVETPTPKGVFVTADERDDRLRALRDAGVNPQVSER